MNVIVHPRRGSYRLYFYDGRRVTGTGDIELEQTGKGHRPRSYRARLPGKGQVRHVPTKELIAQLRESQIYLTEEDPAFISFLKDLQIPWSVLNSCRPCLTADRITPLKKKNAVKYGKETICMDCARRELRREAGYLGGMGSGSITHLEHLLQEYRDLDRVLATLQPATVETERTIFDRLDAHPVMNTSSLKNLPVPEKLRTASGVEKLMPVQELAVEAGLLKGRDLLVVAATASGKTFIGEMAGVKNYMEKRGAMLFLVPLVALANQKYSRFTDRYGGFLDVSLQTGVSRLNLSETRVRARRSIRSAIVVGTYEGIDHQIRLGRQLPKIGTVVIDEVQMLEDEERGHRLDGLIARLRYLAPQAQFLFLSATIGSPNLLAKKLNAALVRYDERPVPLERHLIFTERKEKTAFIKKLIADEYRHTSSLGFKGQTIVFTNARARCHTLADAIGKKAMPYHAGLSAKERHEVEHRLENGEIAAVVTTAALAAGVDFPASQVIFDSLAMGIEWLTVQEFTQMMGRAGRPDFHDLGKVVILAEPGATYAKGRGFTEEEIAIRLLKGEMEEVAPVYGMEESSEEYVANAIACGGSEPALARIGDTMVGLTEDMGPVLRDEGYIRRSGGTLEVLPLGRVMAEHFIGVERLDRIRALVRTMNDPLAIVTELECAMPEEG